jgi:HK97 family phage prohead protease
MNHLDKSRIERRVFSRRDRPVTLEQRVGSEYPFIVGEAAVYYEPGNPGTEFDVFGDGYMIERLAPGCFDRALRDMDVCALFNHDPNLVLGRKSSGTLRLGTTDIGLHYEITPGNTMIAKDVVEHLRRGDITGSSFSFLPVKQELIPQPNGKVVRILEDVDLFDVGPVLTPAYSGASAGLRALGDQSRLRAEVAGLLRTQRGIAPAAYDVVQARARAVEVEMDAFAGGMTSRAERPSIQLQSVLLPVSKFTESEARRWCSAKGFLAGKPDKTRNYYRFAQCKPSECTSDPFTLTLDKDRGVQAVVFQRMDPAINAPFTHTSSVSDTEPSWGHVETSKLPRAAFADPGDPDQPDTWRFAHHWIDGATETDATGRASNGTMYLHRAGLTAAMSAANDLPRDDPERGSILEHLAQHARALGQGDATTGVSAA